MVLWSFYKMTSCVWLSLLLLSLFGQLVQSHYRLHSGTDPHYRSPWGFPRSVRPAFQSSSSDGSVVHSRGGGQPSYTQSRLFGNLKPPGSDRYRSSANVVVGVSSDSPQDSSLDRPVFGKRQKSSSLTHSSKRPKPNLLQSKEAMWDLNSFQAGNRLKPGIVSSGGIEIVSSPAMKVQHAGRPAQVRRPPKVVVQHRGRPVKYVVQVQHPKQALHAAHPVRHVPQETRGFTNVKQETRPIQSGANWPTQRAGYTSPPGSTSSRPFQNWQKYKPLYRRPAGY